MPETTTIRANDFLDIIVRDHPSLDDRVNVEFVRGHGHPVYQRIRDTILRTDLARIAERFQEFLAQ